MMSIPHDKNEPSRFLGEGVAFKAKLIGILEVGEARGDRMCQEALADLKMAIRAAGEHKQRISVHVAIDGLRLRDEKTGDSLYHHPVHKISFIAQDMSDSRAFGYIFGSPDTGHRFFGIKTDKAASQVVIAMRDLFQVVFELKKKEIELAKQQLEGKSITLASRYISTAALDTSKGFLPPPPSSARGRTSQASVASEGGSPFSPAPSTASVPAPSAPPVPTAPRSHFTFEPQPQPPPRPLSPPESKNIIAQDSKSVALLERSNVASPPPLPETTQSTSEPTSSSNIFDVFTELDPLGTGRSKPYVDKKHFFQELKNPPKKVLKDLVTGVSTTQGEPPFQPKFDVSPKPELLTTLTSVGRHSGGSVSIAKPASSNQMFSSTSLFTSDPFAETDPFDNTDPFAESREDPFITGSLDFSRTAMPSDFSTLPKLNSIGKETTLPDTKIGFDEPKIKFPSPLSSLQGETAPLQVSLPPETNRSPRLLRHPSTDSKSSVRQRPQSGKQQHAQPSPSPPPPLPPKKPVDRLDKLTDRSEAGPPLPLPARRRPTPSATPSASASLSWLGSSSAAEDDYLAPVPAAPRRPVPSPTPSPGLDITLAQLLTCGMDELAGRLRMPADALSRMTIAQLTGHLQEYLHTGSDSSKKESLTDKPPQVAERPPHTLEKNNEFEANFEDNFSTSNTDAFVANFDNFNNTNKPSYDRYAVFREIEVEEFKSLPDVSAPNQEEPDSLSSQPDLPCDSAPPPPTEPKPFSEFKLESLTMTSPLSKPSAQNAKLEELKNVINNLHKTSLSPTPDIDITAASDSKVEKDNETKNGALSTSDRYAALRDLSAAESPRPLSADLPDEPELSAPLQVPKERKRSDEKSDGFDHSDFFDCIDNSLSLATADDAFRKSPLVTKEALRSPIKSAEPLRRSPAQLTAPQAMVSGSISDIASGSSPEIVLTGGGESGGADSKREGGRRRGDAWSLLGAGGSAGGGGRSSAGAEPYCQCSSEDSPPPPPPQHKAWPGQHQRRHRRATKPWHSRQTSSSSRDVSPWEEDPPPRDPIPHPRSYHRERHESAGSRERRDSGGSRERRDSGSGRDRDRDRHRRRRHSRDDDDDWSDGGYSRRPGSREARRERGWAHDDRRRPDERGYSTVGRREGRRRGEPPWQSEESGHRYSSTMGNRGWRRSGSSGEGERRSGSERVRPPRHRPPPRQPAPPRSHRSPFEDDFAADRSPSPPLPASPTPTSRARHRHRFFDDFNQSEIDSPIVPKNGTRFRFSNDFSEKDSPKSQNSPFENDFVENISISKKTVSKYESSYANLEKESPMSARVSNFRFRYDKELSSENLSGSPASPRPRHSSPPPSRSLFEDDFSPEPRNGILRATDTNGDHSRNETIHEGEELQVTSKEERTEKIVGFDFGSGKEGGIPENRRSQKMSSKNRPKTELDIKKSESVNIFARESDPFDGDDFFNCTASDKPRRDNWQASFENM